MIDHIIAFALRQRFITLALALLLTVMGAGSFRNLPIEAYPDVGDVRAEVITLWPGHAAEEVERLITIPLENELNGIARVTVIRSDAISTSVGVSFDRLGAAAMPLTPPRHRCGTHLSGCI